MNQTETSFSKNKAKSTSDFNPKKENIPNLKPLFDEILKALESHTNTKSLKDLKDNIKQAQKEEDTPIGRLKRILQTSLETLEDQEEIQWFCPDIPTSSTLCLQDKMRGHLKELKKLSIAQAAYKDHLVQMTLLCPKNPASAKKPFHATRQLDPYNLGF